MKKLFFTFAILIQSVFVAVANDKAVPAQPHLDNVKMYSQPGTSTEVVKSLMSTDEVMIIRKHNSQWMIVSVDGKVGYVLASELVQPKKAKK